VQGVGRVVLAFAATLAVVQVGGLPGADAGDSDLAVAL
jgi:hypothetical protein